MKGGVYCKTLKVNGLVGNKEILILINCGSTHCFLDEKVAGTLECELVDSTPMIIKVADRSKILSKRVYPKFSWEVQGHKFLHPVRLLKLGGYDLVLGCDWLSTSNPVELDFHQLKVTLSQGEDKLILRTLPNETRAKFMDTYSLAKLMWRKNLEIKGELFFNHKVLMGRAKDNRELELLQQYDEIFKEPNSLPLERKIEHFVELLPDVIPRKQHPYKYAYD
ncbi:UNVERIFIED_CONTAM: hypothetical protein Sradi_2335700 [Sesamum radiatum]|uniref:Uncharacterized protein n=1 Tax=Sesamum radiatum TaxID=300843 RepID=A0AAW2T5B0_SESRA